MTDLLSAADLLEIRRDWIEDDVDNRQAEWGTPGTAKVAAIASSGAVTLGLKGLGAGTIERGTEFQLFSGVSPDRYSVAADVDISLTGTATVALFKALVGPAAVDDLVRPRPKTFSPFNARSGLFFSDDQIQAMADEAQQRYGARIHSSNDTRRMWFRAIEYLAVERQIDSRRYQNAVEQEKAQDGGAAHFKRLRERRDELAAYLETKSSGPVFVPVYR
ncbi:MAG TPA: hypothetical protein DCQ64_22300 [Candidatus Rokubacteria bacterium]|nr:hypothetical protein [Candidatus Rokubacteria bacterium]